MSLLIVHYGEIALKGHNRRQFEEILCRRLTERLGAACAGPITRYQGRIGVPLADGVDEKMIHTAMKRVFGVTHYAVGQKVEKDQDLSTLKSHLLAQLARRSAPASFAVITRRSDKSFPMTSEQINREIGRTVQERFGWLVDLESPALTLRITITESDILYALDRHPGPGGMPANSAGRVLGLFSGGIDSPVAAYLMARRGAQVDLLHVHTYRTNAELASDGDGKKILDLKSTLDACLVRSRLFLVPSYPFAIKAALSLGAKIEMVLFRRFILRLARSLAERLDAQALVTGDNLGQVASQTLGNLAAVDFDLSIPIFRPLIAYDKGEIVDMAREIGTYDISIRPYKDCCSLMSHHPRTHVPVELVRSVEADIGMEAIVQEALALAEDAAKLGLLSSRPK